MTDRDGLARFSARSVRRGDAGHRKACATLPEGLARPPLRSPMRLAGGRQKRLPMPRIARRAPSYPADRMSDLYGS